MRASTTIADWIRVSVPAPHRAFVVVIARFAVASSPLLPPPST